MENRILRGVHTALITPFARDGEVDYSALKKIIEYQISEGINGLVPCGTTGESPTLSHEEHDRVIKLTVEYADGRVPVIAGTGSNATWEAVQLSQHAERAGVDAVLLVNPYYNKPTQKGLYLHFKAIADSVSIPCVVYNIKGRTGVNVETDTLVRLMNDCSNIVAVKEASGDLSQIREVTAQRKSNFSVLSGDDNIICDLVEAGGDGVISVAANLIPGKVVEMVSMGLNGDMAGARKLEEKLMPMFKAGFLETNPIPIKTAMAYAGWCEEYFRLPMCTLADEENRRKLYSVLSDLSIKQQKYTG
ncbi:MAG: 4-hydroxy-tetrahydrodipicolinate synthase [Spirochaetota bacterium]